MEEFQIVQPPPPREVHVVDNREFPIRGATVTAGGVEAITDARVPARGTAQGVEQNGGRAWRWRRDVQPLGDQGAFRVDVTVAGPEGGVLGRLSAVRPPAIPPRQPKSPLVPPAGGTPPPAGRT